MRKAALFLGLILTTFLTYFSFAQTKYSHRERKADKHYEQHSFYKASNLYRKIVKKNPINERAKLKLARTYYKANKPGEAEIYYSAVIHKKYLVKSLDYLHYAQVLQSVEKFNSAEKWCRKYLEINPRSIIAQNLIYSLENVAKYYQDSSRYIVRVLNINTDAAEFSPSFFREGIVFVSSRSKKHSLKRNYSRDRSKYLNLYFSEGLIGNELMTTPEKIKGKVNTRFHQGPAAFYQDQQKIIFTSSNTTSSQGTDKNLKLYSATFSNEKDRWEKVIPLSFNMEEYSSGHPTIDISGEVLYFVSDRPGGMGGTDLYKVSKIGKNWGAPINLGNSINTSGNEMFPYIDSNNRLYFSSDGHGGLGGLDIFFVDINNSFHEVQNMGFPINSTRDDFGLIYDESKALGYFSSDRSGQSDLYQYRNTGITLKVLLHNDLLEPIATGQVSLQSHGQTITKKSGLDGTVSFEVSPGQLFQVVGQLEGYEVVHTSFTAPNYDLQLELSMTSLQSHPTQGTLLMVAGIERIKSYVITENQVIEVKDPGINGDSNWLTNLLDTNNIEIDQTVEIGPIHYAFDKSSIDVQYISELDKLAMLMQKYNFIEFELGAHTDALGSDVYNQHLSQERADKALEYLLDNQIESKRLLAVGYGESSPVNKCKDEQPCTKNQHRLNRRTEFRLIYMDENQVVSNY